MRMPDDEFAPTHLNPKNFSYRALSLGLLLQPMPG
jgi:hypothetical protein